jgi:hypothetical protein
VFVERLIRCRTAHQKIRTEVLVAIIAVIVGYFVIVPRDDPRRGQVRGLQMRVGFVLRIARTIDGQRHAFITLWTRRRRMREIVGAPFVDVVAEEGDQIGRCLGNMPMRRIVAEFPVLAGCVCKAQQGGHRIRRRCGACASGRADRAAQHEAIPVPAIGLQSDGVDMHAVREFGQRRHASLCNDFPERVVFRDFPLNEHRQRRKRIRIQWIRQDARPQHDAIRAR